MEGKVVELGKGWRWDVH